MIVWARDRAGAMSGHSKWSTIKRKKGAADAKRGKIFSKIIKEITVAARLGGGDPAGNPRLRHALLEARAANMPADNMERAIKKGTGELEGVEYEELVYEGVGIAGTLVLIETMTDNRNRTNPELRRVFEKNGGQLGAAGSAAWAFDQKGHIRLAASAADEETLFDVAVGAGAEDVALEGDTWLITTARESLDAVGSALEASGVAVQKSSLVQVPKTVKTLDGDDGRRMLGLLEALEDHDDVQNVFSDFEPSDTLLSELAE